MDIKTYIAEYMDEVIKIAGLLYQDTIENAVQILLRTRQQGGRLFILGVGGGAANASHAVNDFRKIANIEAYAPTDNVSELTARTNDDGWETVFVEWLNVSRLSQKDCLLVFSVGGGNAAKNISPNLIRALDLAKETGSGIIGIVGKDGGHTAKTADACILIPVVNAETVTPQTEAFQSIILHLLVSHPALKINQMKWESMTT